jgi:hypothetical protein
MEPQEEKKKSKKWWIIGGIVVVLLLAAGAFMGGMWMVGQATGMSQMLNEEAFNAMLVALEQTPNEEPEIVGVVKSVEDNSLFVSTVASTGAFVHSPGASLSESPPVEVVVERDTVILADVTALDFDFSNIGPGNLMDAAQSDAFAEGTKRVIEEGVLEDIEPNTMIWIWGQRTGDRINADAVLYLVLPISM